MKFCNIIEQTHIHPNTQFVVINVVTFLHKFFFTQQFITNILFYCTMIYLASPLLMAV